MAWTRINIRMPVSLKGAMESQAARLGMSQADYVREALVAYTAWHRALDAVEEGVPVDDLRDPAVVARLLGR